jgi:transposase
MNISVSWLLFGIPPSDLSVCYLVIRGWGLRAKKYHIRLREEDRATLREVIGGEREPGYRILWAKILLELDEGVRGTAVPRRAEIAGRCHCDISVVYRVSRQYARGGIRGALSRKREARGPRKVVSGEAAEWIRALYGAEAPPGYTRWTLRLLAAKAVEAGVVPHISPTSVRKILRTNISS